MDRIINNVKQIIKTKILNPYYKYRLLHGKRYISFFNSKKKKILLLDTPTHGNLGDQAIVYAEKILIDKLYNKGDIYEFTHKECILAIKEIAKGVNEQDIIIIPGGGFLGSLWMNEEDIFINIINIFYKNRIVVFPHTIYFEDSEFGKNEMLRMQNSLNRCMKIHIFARDPMTYKFLSQSIKLDGCNYYESPDIVTSLMYPLNFQKLKTQNVTRKNIVLLCIRDDIERVRNDEIVEWLTKKVKENYSIKKISTYSIRTIYPKNREQSVHEILQMFAEASLVITDRLHGMLFALITSTPCIAMDNLSKKVSGTYFRWLRDIEFIKFVDETNFKSVNLKTMMSNRCKYDNSIFCKYYKQIENEIIEGFKNG